MRSIVDHARALGEDLSLPEAQLNCVLVFALGGGPNSTAKAAESGYFAARAAMVVIDDDPERYEEDPRRDFSGNGLQRDTIIHNNPAWEFLVDRAGSHGTLDSYSLEGIPFQ